jgi:hypothetical protein
MLQNDLRAHWQAAVVTGLLLGACSSGTTTTDGSDGGAGRAGAFGSGGSAGLGGSSASAGAGASSGASGAPGLDSGDVRCVGNPPAFPAFERGCSGDANCVIGFHQVDCCGNRIATGINHSERDRFDAAERICEMQYPGCGCPQGPTTTDTAQMTSDESMIAVACRSGVCTTFVP